jgi:IS30 family transposase
MNGDHADNGESVMVKSTKISLADIARSLKMTPKTARRKMRRGWQGRRPRGGWTFDASKRKEIVAVLKGKVS